MVSSKRVCPVCSEHAAIYRVNKFAQLAMKRKQRGVVRPLFRIRTCTKQKDTCENATHRYDDVCSAWKFYNRRHFEETRSRNEKSVFGSLLERGFEGFEIPFQGETCRATTRHDGKGDRTIVGGVTEERKKAMKAIVLTSVAALHPARMTAVLIRIQYILGCIFPLFFPLGPFKSPLSDHRVDSRKPNEKNTRTSQAGTNHKKIHRSNNATHTTLIDEPRDTEGASIGHLHRGATTILNERQRRAVATLRTNLGQLRLLREIFECVKSLSS